MKLWNSGRVIRPYFVYVVTILAAASFCGANLAAQAVSLNTLDSLPLMHPLNAGSQQKIKVSGNSARQDALGSTMQGVILPVPSLRVPSVQSDSVALSYNQAEAGELPLPRMHFDPVKLLPASALQVPGARAVAPLADANRANPARSSSGAPVAPSASVVAQTQPPHTGPAPSVAPTPKPAVNNSAPVRATTSAIAPGVRPPAPIQRSTAPTIVETAKTRTAPLTTTTLPAVLPSAKQNAAVSMTSSTIPSREVVDAHSLPEYRLVQLPAQTPPPMPPQSLPLTAQDFNGVQGQIMAIKMSGRGWIYTGTGKTPAGVAYIEKTVQPDSEQFRFRLDSIGRHVLQFQRQDVASGLLDKQEASLTIQGRTTGVATGQMQTVSIIQPTVDQYQPEYPIPQDTLPKTVTSSNRSENQLSSYGSLNQPTSMVTATLPVTGPLPTDAAGLFSLALKNDQSRQSAAALALYEKISKDWPVWEKADEVLFRTARLLESASDGKDIKRAYDLYVKIQTEYPYSSWVDQSKERGRYISRTFFHP